MLKSAIRPYKIKGLTFEKNKNKKDPVRVKSSNFLTQLTEFNFNFHANS